MQDESKGVVYAGRLGRASCGLEVEGWDFLSCQNPVAEGARGLDVAGVEVHAHPLGGEIRQVQGSVEPPGSVVVPEVVVGARGLLAAGQLGRCGLVHGVV